MSKVNILTDEAKEAIQQCDETIEEIETFDWPSAGEEFAESVREKLIDFAESIEQAGTVTKKQREAIDNMARGVKRWTERG